MITAYVILRAIDRTGSTATGARIPNCESHGPGHNYWSNNKALIGTGVQNLVRRLDWNNLEQVASHATARYYGGVF